MKLFEFEAKSILKKYGIPIPRGDLVGKSEEVGIIAEQIGKPVVLKSQILVSSRGKSVGIIFAENATEAKEKALNLIGSTIKG
jgi:succinyl-CoA synthetase beta subunit